MERYLLKGLCPALLDDRLTHSERQLRDSCLRGARDIRGGSELLGFRVRLGGAAASWTEVQAEVTVPLLSPSSSQPSDTGAMNLDTRLLLPGVSPKLQLSQLVSPLKLFPVI